ncbi:hypothetical protein NKG94_29655 [Micromonospora sp. M12]
MLALVLLLVNDHVLKSAFPGLVTGKLSDVAGLVLAPPLVAVVLTLLVPRLPARTAALAGLVTVGAGFAVVKSSGYAAELASSAWTVVAGPSLIRADRTDLLTLPALGLAWWSWTRARRRPVRQRPPGWSGCWWCCRRRCWRWPRPARSTTPTRWAPQWSTATRRSRWAAATARRTGRPVRWTGSGRSARMARPPGGRPRRMSSGDCPARRSGSSRRALRICPGVATGSSPGTYGSRRVTT